MKEHSIRLLIYFISRYWMVHLVTFVHGAKYSEYCAIFGVYYDNYSHCYLIVKDQNLASSALGSHHSHWHQGAQFYADISKLSSPTYRGQPPWKFWGCWLSSYQSTLSEYGSGVVQQLHIMDILQCSFYPWVFRSLYSSTSLSVVPSPSAGSSHIIPELVRKANSRTPSTYWIRISGYEAQETI